MVQGAAEACSCLLLGQANVCDLSKPEDAERSQSSRGREGQPDGGGMERRVRVRVRVGVLISFSCLASSLWQADDCTLNTTLFLASRQQGLILWLRRECVFFFSLFKTWKWWRDIQSENLGLSIVRSQDKRSCLFPSFARCPLTACPFLV